MRIITCNVNGIRSAVKKGFWSWASRQKADFICLQEIKAKEPQIPAEILAPKSFHAFYHPADKPGYSGVGVLTRREPDQVHLKMGHSLMDTEGRFLQVDIGKLSVISLYVPSGSSSEKRQVVKYEFMEFLLDFFRELKKKKRSYVICGDINIAHKEIDLKNWRSNQKNSGFLPDERRWLDELFDREGFIDAFRMVNQEADQYTWWSNRGQAWAKNVGWRIDYQITTPNLKKLIKNARIYKDTKFSDHAPLTLDYDWNL